MSGFDDSLNARVKTVTTAPGTDTHGTLNQHPAIPLAYQIGLSEDMGTRRTMEDAYAFVADFANIRGQGYFAIFDGHAGKHAAEWCGQHFHEVLLENIKALPGQPIPDVLNSTFHTVDGHLSKLAQDAQTHSGCTVVAAFLRLEDENGTQSFLDKATPHSPPSTQEIGSDSPTDSGSESVSGNGTGTVREKKGGSTSRIRTAVNKISDTLRSASPTTTSPKRTTTASSSPSPNSSQTLAEQTSQRELIEISPNHMAGLRRVLYTANAGDARAVLCRAGNAVRLTYDHKGSDKQEAKRIVDAGGFVMNNRVNGVLAVTRSLGDSSMKEFVVGSPYTTETELSDEDEFLVLACDGLWDVAEDQKVVDLVRDISDPQAASKKLLDFAMDNFTTDNVTVLVVRFKSPLSK